MKLDVCFGVLDAFNLFMDSEGELFAIGVPFQ